ncbi:MAG: gliding motility protein GldN [Bacteroidetes bacterium]|nr:gliding motility protein GldN [Bacteroidota bacterium]
MKVFGRVFVFMLLVCAANSLSAQSGSGENEFRDGVYDKENAINKRYIPYTHLRQGDVTWEKRVWRRLDMREKLNQPLYFPKEFVVGRTSLVQMVLKGINEGKITAFENDEFNTILDKASVMAKIVKALDTNIFLYCPPEIKSQCGICKRADGDIDIDEEGNPFEYGTIIASPVCPDTTGEAFGGRLTSVSIKEDWFFDKQKSTLEVRILGIGFNAPYEGKEDLGESPMFWIYFPQCRPVFARNEVFNTKNDAERRTFDDIFWKRLFASATTKETNVYNRSIEMYTKGIDALLESDRIKGDIFRWEHDLWQF